MVIVATIGPASMNKNIISKIVNSGADILRLNFSHNTREDFKHIINYSKQINKDIKIMQDLCGSKVRVADCLTDTFKVYNKENVQFCSKNNYEKKKNIIPLNIDVNDIIKGKFKYITMKDNTMVFKIEKIIDNMICCKVIKGGVIRAGKGCNIKGIDRKKTELSKKDKSDIDFAYKYLIDIISQSYVESPKQIKEIRDYLKKYSKYNPRIYAKIETEKGINNICNIAKVSDGIIIGRGDLIPESSIYNVPIYEDFCIKKVRKTGKEIILATHVLDSIQKNLPLTLPEVESIYYAIKMGASGFLLAGETSVSKAPVRAVNVLKSLINKYEENYEK